VKDDKVEKACSTNYKKGKVYPKIAHEGPEEE
jgi:hypothetical protein